MRYIVCFIKSTTKTVSKISRSILSFSLLFGVLFVPIQTVEAGILSSIASIFISDQAYALQANVTPFSILENKNNISYNVNIDNISDDKALSPKRNMASMSSDEDGIDSSCGELNVYVVVSGDTVSKVAKLLEVSENTVIAANGMKKILTRDDVLFIPSVSGVEHTIVKGQTLQQIAKLYKVDMKDIVYCNGITSDGVLAIGDELMIPGGDVKVLDTKKPIKNLAVKEKQYYEIYSTQDNIGLINPVPNFKRISQRLHDKYGVDLAAPMGTPIVAAASGTVLLARNGYNGGYGNMVIIKHSNGINTLYAHQSKIAVKNGDRVSQGEVIGYVGSTGRSTGPHLHYEVRGARNNALDL